MHPPTATIHPKLSQLRFLCQLLFAAFCLFVGYRFFSFYLWALDPAAHAPATRPPAVEAFLPLGAMVSIKRWFLGAEFDTIHPAGLTIFLTALLLGLFLRKSFCGWICPVGFASNLAERVNKKMHLALSLPLWIDIPLLGIKYLLLGFFAYLILWRMDLASLTAFHNSSYNLISDAKMLHFFFQPSVLAGSIMAGIIFLSFLFRNFWCRYLCPYGALLGLLALVSPFQIKRNPDTCIDCKKCNHICPASITITKRSTVRNSECIGCAECVQVCPAPDCLTLSLPWRKKVSPYLLPGLSIGLFFTCYLIAQMTGHWQTQVSVEQFQYYYQMINEIGHP